MMHHMFRRRRGRRGAAVAVAAALACCMWIGSAAAQDEDVSIRQRLRASVEPLFSDAGVAAVLVRRDGQTLLADAHGRYDGAMCKGMLPADEAQLTLRHRFDVASVAKMFTSAAILRLQMQGKLDVHDPVANHVGDIIGLVGHHRAITLHHLMTHTSGLPNDLSFRAVDLGKRAAMLRHVLTSDLSSVPGEAFEYNNVAYFVLAGVVEIVSGESFETFVAREVFEPAGMMDSGFPQPAEVDRYFETPRVRAADGMCIGTASYYAWSWGHRGATGVVTTAGDLARWDDALRGDALFDDETKSLYFQPVQSGYACGWHVGLDDAGRDVQFHSGRTAGFAAMVTRYPKENALIVTLCDEHHNPMMIDRALRGALFAGDDEGGPAIGAVVHFGLRADEANEYGVVTLREDVAFVVERRDAADGNGDADARVVLRVQAGGDELVRIEMQRGVAKKLAHELRQVQEAKNGDEPEQPEVVLASKVYEQDEAGDIALREPLNWRVMPKYVGVGRDGQRVEDARTTVVLRDPARQFWPIILRLDGATAEALLRDVEAAVQ